jgi:hypothetical protein
MDDVFRRLVRPWSWLHSLPPRRLGVAVLVLIGIPLGIALVALAGGHWNPVLDLAMTELRVRDVAGSHTPLIGLPGRIGVFPDQGSHPGPLSFYLLTPTYRGLGSSAWALLAATVVLDMVAIGAALWLAHRRGGTRLMLATGALAVMLLRGYGLGVVTQPWNPYLPLLFWLVVLLATWSVLAGDRAMIVVVAAAGSLCAQTHLPYVGLTLGMGALCVGSLALDWRRHPMLRNEVQRWLGVAVVVGLVLWVPVLIDQFTNTPGNLSMLRDYFRSPPEPPVGPAEGVRLMLRHLDVTRLVPGLFQSDGSITRAAFRLDGTVLPGLALLLAWLSAAVWSWRRRHFLLGRLNIVLGWSLVLGTVSMGRIFGKVWYYLTLWAWMSALLMVVSVVWTLSALALERSHDVRAAPRMVIAVVLTVIGVGQYVALYVDAAGTPVPEQHLSDTLGQLVGPTAAALSAGLGDAAGDDGTYLVTWNDARYFGSQGYGLVSELEREGFHVGVLDTWRVPVTHHRVIDPAAATAEVRLATGFYIDTVAVLPGAELVIEIDPRDEGELAEYARIEADVRDALVQSGADDLVPLLETNLFGVQLDPRVPVDVQQQVNRLLELGTPTAVFIVPVGSPL